MAGCVLQAARRGPSHPRLLVAFVSVLAVLSAARIGRHAWGHVGHAFTCAIAQAAAAVAALLPPTARGSLPAALLTNEAAAAVKALLPPVAEGSLPAVCSWADDILHSKGWEWSMPLHFAGTPDFACSYDERRELCLSYSSIPPTLSSPSRPLHSPPPPTGDCTFAHHPGVCVANAIVNYTSQLLTYSPHSSAQPHSSRQRSIPPSSLQPATPFKPVTFPTSPHRRSLLRGVGEAESGVLGMGEEDGEAEEGEGEEGEGEEREGEVGEGEEEMVRVVRGVVRNSARSAAHASLVAAAAAAAAASGAGAAGGGAAAASEQRAALCAGSIKHYNLTEALMLGTFTRVHVTWSPNPLPLPPPPPCLHPSVPRAPASAAARGIHI
ncbi:unnamed protein product [Closterium sp. Naga37s-1]|nr:unnamed protein product [Closterium sp. Naga37s-1]